jgi:DNA gyrase subunit A
VVDEDDERSRRGDAALTVERIAELGAAEQFILTVTDSGFGKRSSAYEYRRTGRGGQGLTAHGLGGRAGTRLAAAFPVEDTDELLMVTSSGQMIRTRVGQVRVVGRSSQGVTIFKTADGERVVSVERLAETPGGDDEGGAAVTRINPPPCRRNPRRTAAKLGPLIRHDRVPADP